MYFYSDSTKGFYHSSLHGSNIPSDCIQISDEQHREFVEKMNTGYKLIVGVNNSLTLVESIPEITFEDNAVIASNYLSKTDWINNQDVYDTSMPIYLLNRDEFLNYRSRIRAIIVNKVSGQIEWPIMPEAKWSTNQ